MELAVQTMASYASSLELARWAEKEGLAGFAVADHYLTGPETSYALDQLTVLGAVAAHTRRIELSTLVSPITFRHPAVMLKSAAALDEISGGRFTLGVGAGWMADEHERFGLDFPPTGERFDRLEEALAYLRAAIDADEAGFAGHYYRLAPGPPPEPGGQHLRLVVGGGGRRRTPALAGRFGDEFNVFPDEVPYADRIDVARRAAVDAGRDPDAMLISTAFPLVVGADAAEAERRIEEVAARRQVDPARVRQRYRELGIPLGTADEFRTRLEELAAVGIRRVYFQVAFDPLEDIDHAVGLVSR